MKKAMNMRCLSLVPWIIDSTHKNKCCYIVFFFSCLFTCMSREQSIVPIQHLWGSKKRFSNACFTVIHLRRRWFWNPDSNVQIMFSLCFLLRQDHHRVGLHVATSLLRHIFGLKWQSPNVKQGERWILVSPLFDRPRSALQPSLLLLDLQQASDEWGDTTEAKKGETKHRRSLSLPNFAKA